MSNADHGSKSPTAVVISGAGGGGIGTAVAAEMFRIGKCVYTIERTEAARTMLINQVGLPPENVIVGDVADEKNVEELEKKVRNSSVPLTALIHNAARGAQPRRIWDVTRKEFEMDISDILIGGFLLSKYFSRSLINAAPSSIVFVSSSAAIRGARGRGPSYAAAKAGLHGFMHSLALDLAPHDVTVNTVCPTQTLTPRVLRGARRTEAEIRRRASQFVPLGRPALPNDVASVICFLCSPGARYMTGKTLEIDGGQSLAPIWTADERPIPVDTKL